MNSTLHQEGYLYPNLTSHTQGLHCQGHRLSLPTDQSPSHASRAVLYSRAVLLFFLKPVDVEPLRAKRNLPP